MRSPRPAPADAAAGGGLGVRDAESLFRTKPIAEIRAVEATTRREIDEKKEELRQLVGTSYRDLIDSADSILRMRSSCDSISSNFAAIDDAVRSLSASASASPDSAAPPGTPAASTNPARARLYGLASRVKYLVDSPENIWGCLDESMLLEAAGRYLRAKVVHGLIGTNREILAKFPLLRHQWQIVESFKGQISQRSRERLVDQGLAVAAYADALAAAAAIDNIGPKQLLALFLDSRRSWISQKLPGCLDAVSSSAVLFDVVRMIRASLGQAGQLFVHAVNEMPLFYKTILGSPPGTQLFGVISNPEEEVKLWMLHRDELESAMVLLEPEFIAKTCSAWLKSCCEEIFGEITSGKRLFDYIASGEALGSSKKLVREALDGLEGLDESLERWLKSAFGSDIESPWDQIRELILKDGKDVLEDKLEEAFIKRMKEIINSEFESLISEINVRNSIEAINEAASSNYSNDFQAYLKKLSKQGGVWFSELSQKKTGILFPVKPTVENDFSSCLNAFFGSDVTRIKDAIDSKCGSILEDLLCFVESHSSTTRLKELAPYLQEKCHKTISIIVKDLEDHIKKLAAAIKSNEHDKEHILPSVTVERTLFIGRLLFALRNYSTHVLVILGSPRKWVKETISTGTSLANLPTSPQPMQPKGAFDSPLSVSHRRNILDSPSSPKKSFLNTPRRQIISAAASLFMDDDKTTPLHDELNNALGDLCVKAYSIWETWVANELSIILLKNLRRDDELSASAPIQGWEVITIKQVQEESKEGSLEIKISLPSMPSLYISSFLFQACLEIHKVGGHILDKLILQSFAWRLLKKVVEIYENFLAAVENGALRLSEKGTLQILLDLQFVADSLSGGKDSTTGSTELPSKEDSSKVTKLKPYFMRKQVQSQHDSASMEAVMMLRNRLSQRLDPIDWATYEPYLWENTKQSYLRYAVLFGFLVQLNRMYTDIVQKLPTTLNTSSNIMRCSRGPHYRYLPISAPALSSKGTIKSVLQSSADEPPRSPWRSYSNGEQSPKPEFDDSSTLGVATPLLKSFMTQVGSKFEESTSRWGSMLSDGQVGLLKGRSAAAMSTFGDMLPGPAAGLLSSLTSGAARFDS